MERRKHVCPLYNDRKWTEENTSVPCTQTEGNGQKKTRLSLVLMTEGNGQKKTRLSLVLRQKEMERRKHVCPLYSDRRKWREENTSVPCTLPVPCITDRNKLLVCHCHMLKLPMSNIGHDFHDTSISRVATGALLKKPVYTTIINCKHDNHLYKNISRREQISSETLCFSLQHHM